MIQLFIDAAIYVANSPMFYGSMGFTTATAMFIGALLYDGNIQEARKGLVAVISYVVMLVWTTGLRVFPNAVVHNFVYSPTHDGRAFAGMVTIIYISLAWFLGFFLGIHLFSLGKKYKGF